MPVPTRLMERARRRRREIFSYSFCRGAVVADRLAAREIRGIIDAAASLVLRDLRERAERPAAIDLAVGGVRRGDRCRRLALLAPLLERRERVEDVRSLAAAAVCHPGREEEAHRLVDLFLSDRFDDVLEVCDR